MNADEIRNMVRPSVLLHVEDEIKAANGGVIVIAGNLVAVKAWTVDRWGVELAVYPHPRGGPSGFVSITDLERAKVRPPTADEERVWIRLGEKT